MGLRPRPVSVAPSTGPMSPPIESRRHTAAPSARRRHSRLPACRPVGRPQDRGTASTMGGHRRPPRHPVHDPGSRESDGTDYAGDGMGVSAVAKRFFARGGVHGAAACRKKERFQWLEWWSAGQKNRQLRMTGRILSTSRLSALQMFSNKSRFLHRRRIRRRHGMEERLR